MKRITGILAVLLCIALAAGVFSACGKEPVSPTEPDGTEQTAPAETTDAEDAQPQTTAFTPDFSVVSDYTADNTCFVIGAVGPLSGDAAARGKAVKYGASLAVEEINGEGGVNGIELAFRMEDDEGRAALADEAYDALYEGGMQISLGAATADALETFAARTAEDGVFTLVPAADAAPAAGRPFLLCAGDAGLGASAAKELAANYKNVGVLRDGSDKNAVAVCDAFVAGMTAAEAACVEQRFSAADDEDFSAQAEAFAGCDAIFLPVGRADAARFAGACAAAGLEADLYGLGSFAGLRDRLDGDVPNRLLYFTYFDAGAADDKTVSFGKAYEARYGGTPDLYAAAAYDAVYAIAAALTDAGADNAAAAPEVLGDALAAVFTSGDFSVDGVTGKTVWDRAGAPAGTPAAVEVG